MKIRLRRMLSMLLAVCMAAPMLVSGAEAKDDASSAAATPAQLAAKMVGTSKERIDEVTVAGRTCYMYVPESPRIGNILALTPIVAVFGDQAFTAKTALSTAKNSGFAELAKRDGLCILFVNPIKSWGSKEDAAAVDALYAGIYDTYSSRPDVVFTEGKGTLTDKDGNSRTVYPGSIHGLQLFAMGSGADYVAANFTTPHNYSVNYALQELGSFPGFPSGLALFSPSTLTVPQDNTLVIPTAIVNGPSNSEAFADAFNVNGGVSKVIRDGTVKGFDADTVVSLYDQVVGKFYYTQGQFREFPLYTINGVVEVNGTKKVSTGNSIEYYEYLPEDLDLTKEGSVPLMLWCHGMGGEAEAMLSFSEWPLIGRDEGFIVVSIDQHASFTSEEIMEVLDMILEESPYIDTTRIYASGFSMGSAKTWDMAFKNWKRFAGIVPCALGIFGDADAYKDVIAEDVILPTFYLAGGQSAMELGSASFTQGALKNLWPMNGLGEYEYDEDAGQWGAVPTTTMRITYRDDAVGLLSEEERLQVLTVDAFESPDGNVYTWLAVNEKKPHTLTNNDAHIVWQYMKRFSRTADGKIVVAPEEAPSKLRDTMTASMTGNGKARVDEVTVAGRTCYMYVPESARVGNFLCLTPIVTVFGDKAYTAETALAAAEEGFQEIAERDGLCILFVNPIKGWDSAEDAAAADELFADIYNTYSSKPDVVFTNGKGTITDKEGNSRTVYPGSLHGLQMFGDGAGADYVAANFTKPHLYSANYSLMEFSDLPGFPSGLALFSPKTLKVPEDNSLVIPMAIVNGPANADEFATAFQSTTGIWETVRDKSITGFSSDVVTKLYDEIVSKYYYSQGQFRLSPKYTVNGIIEVNNTKKTADGKVIEYYEYIPEDLDVSKRHSVPLLLYFHGGGGEAEAMVSWTEWPEVGKEYGFEVISMDQHGSYSSAEVVEVLDQILAERSYLDPTRVYAGGFSMGGGKTWNLGLKFTSRLAGIIPTAAGTMAEGYADYVECISPNAIIPTFYIAGGASPLAELPTEKPNNVNEVLGYLWTTNWLGEYTRDPNSGSRFGQPYTSRLTIPYLETCDSIIPATQESLSIHTYPSVHGGVYTYLCINANKPHTITGSDAHVAWEYMRHFSRNSDGKICIDGKAIPDAPCASFTDIGKDKWYHDAVDHVLDAGLMTGVSDGKFAPDASVTMGTLVTALWKLAGEPKSSAQNPFTDVAENADYAKAAVWAAEKELVSGTTFGADKALTREQMVVILYQYAKAMGADVSKTADLSGYPDAAVVSESAKDAMGWAVGTGLIRGTFSGGKTYLAPGQEATRAQVASVLLRYPAQVK